MQPRLLAFGLVVLAASGCGGSTRVELGHGANASRAPEAFARYGCGSCHSIAGIADSQGAEIGPKLSDFARHRYIAGRLANTPANLIRWIRDPQGVDPGNVMPYVGVTDQDARDIAAYLYQH